MIDWLVPFQVFSDGVKGSADRAHVGLRHGSMRCILYAPPLPDPQTPHEQDELYIVHAGSGDFVLKGERRAFGPGDVIFVPAGADHRFENYTSDFTTWAVFWGPKGGED